MKADVFFFISSIAVIVVSIGILIAGYYVVRILRRIEVFAERLEERISDATQEVKDVGDNIKGSFIYNMIFKKGKRGKISKK